MLPNAALYPDRISDTMASTVEKIALNEVFASTQLPALPASAVQILRAAQDPNSGPADLAKPIEADIGLMGQVLRFVNSSYFGFSREITSIQQAITLLGVKPIQNFALWSAVFSLVPNPKFGSFDLKHLWQDSLRRGILSRELGKTLRLPNCEELFAASLLQDIAIPILLQALPEVYEELITERKQLNRRLSELEQSRFGWDHAQAAASLCRNWGLPETFAKLIERHANPQVLLTSNPPEHDAACVAVSAMLPSCTDTEWNEQNQFFQSLDLLVPNGSVNYAEVFTKVDKQCEEFAPLLKLPPPAKTLAQWLIAAARALQARSA